MERTSQSTRPGRIGTIRDDDAPPAWTVPIGVVIVTLCYGTSRHAPSPIQWPADVLIDGISRVGTEPPSPS